MRSIFAIVAGASYVAGFARADEAGGFLALPLRRSNHLAIKKRDTPESEIVDVRIAYVAPLGIGNPPQDLELAIDTGSSPVWVNPVCSYARNPSLCAIFPQYDPALSDPAPSRVPELDGYQDYYSGDWALMEGYSDTFWWGETTMVPGQAFGVANDSDGSSMGFLGLGPDLRSGFESPITEFNVLSTMVREKVIESRAFSLGLEDTPMLLNGVPGSLIFGGIDKNQFGGPLFKLPILPPDQGLDDLWRYWIPATSVQHLQTDGSRGATFPFKDSNATFLLDSGTTGIYLERESVSSFMDDMGLKWQPGAFPDVDCSLQQEAGEFMFRFGESEIRVPYSSLVLEVATGECIFTLTSRETSAVDLNILGLSFLRSVYSVFDWDNQEIHLAQRAECGEGSDIVAIGAGTDAIPAIKGNCNSGALPPPI